MIHIELIISGLIVIGCLTLSYKAMMEVYNRDIKNHYDKYKGE